MVQRVLESYPSPVLDRLGRTIVVRQARNTQIRMIICKMLDRLETDAATPNLFHSIIKNNIQITYCNFCNEILPSKVRKRTREQTPEKSANTHRKHRHPSLSPASVRRTSARARCHGSLAPRKEDAAWRAIVYRSTTTTVRPDNRAAGTPSLDPRESNCNEIRT